MSSAQPDAEGALSRYAEAVIPTEYGEICTIVFRELPAGAAANDDGAGTPIEHIALVFGDVAGAEAVLARVHSECWTGETIHSFKCDCREQLHTALDMISREEGAHGP